MKTNQERQRKIVIIEDEKDMARIMQDYIKVNGYEVYVANSGLDGMNLIEMTEPDFIILDIMLPDADGIELCQQIREKHDTPILILSARGSDTDKVLGLGFGADDYMTKPFSPSELVARINAHLRREERSKNRAVRQDEVLQFGELVIDQKAYQVSLRGREISLSAKEFQLLFCLASNYNQVFSKSVLLDKIWGYDVYGDENTITVYVRRLREKLEDDPATPRYIKTVWGVGYKFSNGES
ncbi:DNA-binding response regulator, OmpR family, contains REC and winged-helix (wHTH) domain [Fontibacillus panacisegetis]|uniref:DNA-binding response regulator, OmpR family, contains REC and winged-helix (WHTH) domain n=1 Tax=Fontibacillus panacisegetis TaxID=670482 RepID=A0A1G7J325_9BACL|nr:response regulator transcription factor [Fontibacillus panacisegetis]SDF19285.1 DNA-binding response regulator, OmpR family, contains REC and winged-helix (wHTH) domain [Fontibacillus panacisegetis]